MSSLPIRGARCSVLQATRCARRDGQVLQAARGRRACPEAAARSAFENIENIGIERCIEVFGDHEEATIDPKGAWRPCAHCHKTCGGLTTARDEDLLASSNGVQQARKVCLGLVARNRLSHELSLSDGTLDKSGVTGHQRS